MPIMMAIIFFLLRLWHPYYISVTEIEYLQKEKEIGISCKVFTDDLENALKISYQATADLTGGDRKKNDALLSAYFIKHIGIQVNGKNYPLKYVGYEIDKEAAMIYLDITQAPSPDLLDITTDLMYDYKKEQVNIIHFIREGNRQSVKLTYPDKEAKFSAH